MKIIVTSIFVEDQDKALAFYRDKLDFVVKHDIPMGAARWITLVSPEEPGGTELLLEPNGHPAAKEYQQRLFADGIPVTMFGVDDIGAEYERLLAKGVKFVKEPATSGNYAVALLDDTCGNLIQIIQMLDQDHYTTHGK